MNSSRSQNIYSNDTIENSLLDWIDSFNVDTIPQTFEDLYQGVALLPPLDIQTIFNKITFPVGVLQKYEPEGDYIYIQDSNNEFYKTQIKMKIEDLINPMILILNKVL